MSRSSPSLLALLGLVAVAGYQNRGRISEMLSDVQTSPDTDRVAKSPNGRGFLSEIGQVFQGGAAGSAVPGAISDLVQRFQDSGRGDTAASWVSDQPNRPIDVDELEVALGDDTLAELSAKTGMSRKELLLRLNTALPEVVNRMTPQGRLPTRDEGQDFL
jgi:uncharacterized protein YidB (DUF937 family)